MKKKIAILGTAPSWKDAPFQDKDWEIWVCNRAGLDQKPWDRLFEIHHDFYYGSPDDREDYLKKLRAIKPPQQMISVIEIGGPANLVIDRDKLFEKYGRMWFSSSFAFMIAHALEVYKPTDIGFYGVDFESIEELHVQFYATRHLMDIASRQGVKIHVADRSSLMREPHAYPDRFETVLAFQFEEKAAMCKKYIRRVQEDLRGSIYYEGYYRGRLGQMDYDDEDYKTTDKKHDKCIAGTRELEATLNRLKGELWATQHYRRLFCWNVLPPDLIEADEIDAEQAGP